MNNRIKKILTALLSAGMAASILSCGGSDPGTDVTTEPYSAPTKVPITEGEDIVEKTDYVTQTWIPVDIAFETEKEYKRNTQLYADFFADFTNRETGTKLSLPGFWNGEKTFVVRFAPTEYGIWDFVTRCEGDESLAGKTGSIAANQYKGDLEIYRRGFVKTDGSKHFVYDDGTPFFYLGDTHWGMYKEEFDEPGPHAGNSGAESHFKYIVDKRVEQGFTVYQSEPIDTRAVLTDGSLSPADTRRFTENDEYYRYIAEKGLVHANAQFFFAGLMNATVMDNEEYLEAISRYWVARYGAFPVMWTLAQEIDKDFYAARGDNKVFDYKNNPWVRVAEYIHKYDAYNHPLSGHQEHASWTTVTGEGTRADATNNGASVFLSDEVTEKTGHDWWAAQWTPNLDSLQDYRALRDYYNSPKVAINYEPRYCYLWTKNFGARAQSWISMLNGFAGVGYGAVDIWLYKSTYDTDTTTSDGIEEITPADKAVYWSEAVEFESAYQQGYMRNFLEQYEWWKLKPDFADNNYFVPTADNVYYACATIGSELYIVYFYSNNTGTGRILDLVPGAAYEAKWFDPKTNAYSDIGDFTADAAKEAQPSWEIPSRPAATDYVLVVRKK